MQPPLAPDLEYAYAVFCELSPDRNTQGAIPWTAIDAFARRHGIDHIDEYESLLAQIRAIEKIWRELTAPPPKSDG